MKYLYAVVALILCLPAWAQYGRNPRPIYTPDPGGYFFMGANLRPMKNNSVFGTEFSFNTRTVAQLYFGLYYCYAQGKTKELYGYNLKPDKAMLSTTTFGLDVSCLFPNREGSQAFVLSCTFCPEFIKLGEQIPSTSSRLGVHTFYITNRAARNAFYSIRPGLRYIALNNFVMMGVHYNFLTGHPQFGTTKDFEGFQYIACFRLYSTKKKSYYFY